MVAPALVLLLLMVVAPVGAMSGPSAAPKGASVVPAAGSSGINANVTWNGMNIGSAGTISSGIMTNFGSAINLVYTWSATSGIGPRSGPTYNISTARLQMFYFGFPIGTRDVINSNPIADRYGQFNMSWDPGVLQWILTGDYKITASLIAPNGTSEWSQDFFIHVTAPAAIGAAMPILLILVGIWEVYSLARSGRQAAISAPPAGKGKEPAAAASGTAASTDTSTTSPTKSDDAAAAPPKEDT